MVFIILLHWSGSGLEQRRSAGQVEPREPLLIFDCVCRVRHSELRPSVPGSTDTRSRSAAA